MLEFVLRNRSLVPLARFNSIKVVPPSVMVSLTVNRPMEGPGATVEPGPAFTPPMIVPLPASVCPAPNAKVGLPDELKSSVPPDTVVLPFQPYAPPMTSAPLPVSVRLPAPFTVPPNVRTDPLAKLKMQFPASETGPEMLLVPALTATAMLVPSPLSAMILSSGVVEFKNQRLAPGPT